MHLYFVDSRKIGGLNYLIFGLYPIFFIVGVAVSKNLEKKSWYAVIVLALVLLLIIFVLTVNRAFFSGTYGEFLRHDVRKRFPDILLFFRSDIGKFVLLGGVIFIAISLFLVSKDKKLKDFLSSGKN